MRLTWPLTGRSEEMRLIEAALDAPDLSGIVIRGAAGVGKSRVAREALDLAESKDFAVRWVVGTSSAAALPLGAFASWAPSTVTDNLQLVRGVIEALTRTSTGSRVLVGVDDVHLLDDLSIFVLHQIVQRRAAKVMFTVRDGEPLPAAVQEVWKAGQFDRLDVQPLSRSAIGELLSSTLGGSVDPNAAQRLWKLTKGNVLYLRNIVEQEVVDERLVRDRGYWRWMGEPIVPARLAELIEAWIGALPPSVSDVIDVLAVGEPIELASLSRITDPLAVEEADSRGLIMLETVDHRVEARVAHPLYGEVRRKRAASTRLRRLRGLVARELARADECDDVHVAVRRATLSLDSDLEPGADLLVRAARGATWLTDLPLAERLAGAAIRVGGGPDANLIRAYALSALSRGEEADAVLAAIPTGELNGDDRGRLAFLRATNRFFTLADPAGAKRLIDEASLATPAHARNLFDAFLTVYWAAMGIPEEARHRSDMFAWKELPDLVATRVTAWAKTVSAGDAGRTSEAVAAAEAGYPVPIRCFVIIGDGHVGALLHAGRINEAKEVADRLLGRAAETPRVGTMLIPVAARAALGAGRLDVACSLLGSVVEELYAAGEHNGWGYRCQIPLTMALAMRGSTDEAAAALATLETHRHPGWRYLDYEYAIARAWVAAAQGAISNATTTVLAASEIAHDNGQFAPEVMCLQTAAQFGDPSGAPRLRELAAIVEGPRVGLAAWFAEALHGGNGTELFRVSEHFALMGDLIAAADAAARAAVAFRDQNRRGHALTCAARAEALAEECGGADTPALREAAGDLPLTTREREIAMLLGRGLPSRAVAERLTLSVRTVENHIYRAMTKTGATSRSELVAMLPEPRLTSHS